MATKLSTDRLKFLFILFSMIAVLVTGGAPLLAQTEAKEEAKDLFFEGVLLFDQGKYASALAKFSGSYELHGHWQILYNIGNCYLQLNDLPSAADMLTQYLEGGGMEIKKDLIVEVGGILKKIKPKLGTMRLTGHYAGGVLTIDGVKNPRGAEGKDVFLTPGVYHVKLTRGEDVLLDTKISIEEGEGKEIYVVKAKPSGVKKEVETPPDKEIPIKKEQPPIVIEKIKKPGKKMKNSGWALFGVSMALLVMGSATGSMAIVRKNDVVETEDTYLRVFEESSVEELELLKEERDKQFNEGMNYSIVSSVFFGLAGASALISVLLLPLGYRKAGKEKKADLDLHITPGSLGISLQF